MVRLAFYRSTFLGRKGGKVNSTGASHHQVNLAFRHPPVTSAGSPTGRNAMVPAKKWRENTGVSDGKANAGDDAEYLLIKVFDSNLTNVSVKI